MLGTSIQGGETWATLWWYEIQDKQNDLRKEFKILLKFGLDEYRPLSRIWYAAQEG